MNDKLNIVPVAWLYELSRRIYRWSYNFGDRKDPLAHRKIINQDSKCPICNEPLYGYDDYDYDIHMNVESYWDCPNKHYGYEYAYGATREFVGTKEFGASYTYNDDQWKIHSGMVTKEVNRMKNRWYHTWFVIQSSFCVIWYAITHHISRLKYKFGWNDDSDFDF